MTLLLKSMDLPKALTSGFESLSSQIYFFFCVLRRRVACILQRNQHDTGLLIPITEDVVRDFYQADNDDGRDLTEHQVNQDLWMGGILLLELSQNSS
jgi:hypothetical protein